MHRDNGEQFPAAYTLINAIFFKTPAVPDGETTQRLFNEQQTKAARSRVASEVELTEASGVCLTGLSRA